jgi:hypothetical protein
MMNYGYDTSDKDQELGLELMAYVSTLPADKYGMRPYVEVDGLYAGVRIRRITHYSDEDRWKIVKGADAVYDRVMKGDGS